MGTLARVNGMCAKEEIRESLASLEVSKWYVCVAGKQSVSGGPWIQ